MRKRSKEESLSLHITSKLNEESKIVSFHTIRKWLNLFPHSTKLSKTSKSQLRQKGVRLRKARRSSIVHLMAMTSIGLRIVLKLTRRHSRIEEFRGR